MQSTNEPFAERLLRWLADSVYRYPRLYFYPQIFLFLICILYTVNKLQFDTSRNDLVGSDKKYHQNFLKFKKEFPGQDDLVVVVESEQMEKNRQFVERLGARLEAETNLFTDVFYKGDLKLMGPKALLFVPENDLKELKKTLRDYEPFIQTFSQATNLSGLFQLVNKQIRTSPQEKNEKTDALLGALPALQRIIDQATDSLKRPGSPPSPGVDALFGNGEEAQQQVYITFAGGRIFLVTAHARTEDLNGDAVEKLRDLVHQTMVEVPGLNVGITGEPVLEYDEMAQSQKDTTVATIVSLILAAFIFIYGYQESGRPLKATFCLIIGLGFTMGYTTLVVGHLNILTITFAPILIGLAIDYGVHLISRYEEELRHGTTQYYALGKAIVNTGMGVFTGCLTTAGAFFAMGLTDFKGIQEMGIISGGGLLICLVPMMTMLPVLLLRGKQNIIDHQKHEVDHRARIEQMWLKRPVVVAVTTGLLCAVSFGQFHKVYFDYNLLNMQSAGLPAVEFEKKLLDSASNSVLFAAVVATNLQQATELQAKLVKLKTVADVKSMSEYLASDQTEKVKELKEIKKIVAPINFPPLELKSADVEDLSQTLYSFQGYIGAILEEVRKEEVKQAAEDAAKPPVLKKSQETPAVPGQDNRTDMEKLKDLDKQLVSLHASVNPLRVKLLEGDRAANGQKMGEYQYALLDDLQDTFNALKTQDDSGSLRAEDLPVALRNRFIGVTQKYLLQVFPKEDVWQRKYQEEFVKELRTVDPNVTGTPVQLLEYTTLLKDSYVQAAWYSLAAIAVMVFFHFRSFVCVILSLLPVAIGTIWMVGFMGIYGIPFNPANIMTLPLVIGIGVTNGIHILNRYAEEANPSIFSKSTGKAVVVSALTTIAGFGSLMLAQHQGIKSLGYVMTVGVATCMLAALMFLPSLLNLLARAGWKLKKPSGNNALLPPGREEPR